MRRIVENRIIIIITDSLIRKYFSNEAFYGQSQLFLVDGARSTQVVNPLLCSFHPSGEPYRLRGDVRLAILSTVKQWWEPLVTLQDFTI